MIALVAMFVFRIVADANFNKMPFCLGTNECFFKLLVLLSTVNKS